MKKILAIAPYPYLPFYSGGQKFIAQFFTNLAKEVNLTVITVAENDLSLATNYKVITLLRKPFTRYIDRSLIKKITRLIQQEQFDAIIWEHPYYAWLASAIKKKTGIRTIIQTHNIEYQRFRSMGRWWWPVLKNYEKWAFKKADALLFITPEDKQFAISEWKLNENKCFDLPFGIEINEYPQDKVFCKKMICQQYLIDNDETIILFNGVLNYKPNLDALKVILEKINPLLINQTVLNYKIIVCGKNLPAEMNDLTDYSDKNIIYAGFVENIEIYFKAADLFLNPVMSGGGIKTKMVEAIAYGATVIATETGAVGINRAVSDAKLKIVNDHDWDSFAEAIRSSVSTEQTPKEYYQYYYWENVIKNILPVLTD